MKITGESIRRVARLAPFRFKKRIFSILREKPADGSIPVFIAGLHRSGTNMLLDVLERSPDTLIFNENDKGAFENYRIKNRGCILSLLQKSRYPLVIFKPLNDTQRIDKLIKDHPDCKVIWIYRRYEDMVVSAFNKWGHMAVNTYRDAVLHDSWDESEIIRRDQGAEDIINRFYSENLSPFSAWALTWYLRNEILFRYGLHRTPEKVLLVKYDAIVKNPAEQLERIFDFLGLSFTASCVSIVSGRCIEKCKDLAIDPGIRELCEEMMARLDSLWSLQWKGTSKRGK